METDKKIGWRGKREHGRTFRFTDDEIRGIDRLAAFLDLPSSVIVRKFVRAGIHSQRLQRELFGDDVTQKGTA
jgi:hypothetical protein